MLIKQIKATNSLSIILIASLWSACIVPPIDPMPDQYQAIKAKAPKNILNTSDSLQKPNNELPTQTSSISNNLGQPPMPADKPSTRTGSIINDKAIKEIHIIKQLELKEVTSKRARVWRYFQLAITPAYKGIALDSLRLYASVSTPSNTGVGVLKGVSGKQGKSARNVKNVKLVDLYLTSSKCKGAEDTSFEQGETITIKLKYKPPPDVTTAAIYTLQVVIKGDNSTKDIIYKIPSNT